MAQFLKHIGKHGDRKIAVVFREVPGEPHMALVVYTELLNRNIHDPLIKTIESDIGQNSESLADALNRSYTNDGRPILQLLHLEGMIKKVQTELIVMTPAPNVTIKLSELNKLLDEMKQGEDAVKRLEEIDKSTGMQSPADVARRMREPQRVNESKQSVTPSLPPIQAPTNGALSDSQLAAQFRVQAQRMQSEAKGLMAESERLMKEASQLDGTHLEQTVKETVINPSIQNVEPVKKAGRPKKVKAA